MGAQPHWPTAIFGLATTGFALFMLDAAFEVPLRASDRVLGPRLFPIIVMGGLAALALLVAIDAWRNGPSAGTDRSPVSWTRGALVLGGIGLFAVLVEPAGFIVATAALFSAVARAFVPIGSGRGLVRGLARDFAIGLALAGVTYLVFTRGFGLNLPAGDAFKTLIRSG